MTNYICEGDRLESVAPSGGVVAGELILVGSKIAVAQNTVAQGGKVVSHTEGVFEVAKETGAITIGQPLYLKADTKTVTTSATGNVLAGYAYSAAASSDTTVYVSINECVQPVVALVANVGGAAASDAITTINALLAALKAAGIMANA